MPINESVLGGIHASNIFVPANTVNPAESLTERLDKTKVSQTITDGVTTSAPSENAVYDALAAKVSRGIGIGENVVQYSSALNNLKSDGHYWVNDNADAPNTGYFYIEAIAYSNRAFVVQRATEFYYQNAGQTGRTFTRVFDSIGWSAWKQIATTDNPVFTGNVSVTGTQYLGESGVANAKQLQIFYDKTNNFACLQSIQQDVGYMPLRLNPLGGGVEVGGQIKFPATQNPSSDPNTLDDYEEGTWTPVLGSEGSFSGQTYSSQVGKYIKIGNSVTCYFSVALTNKGTIYSGSYSVLRGLPFSYSENYMGSGVLTSSSGFTNSPITICAYIGNNVMYLSSDGVALAIGNLTNSSSAIGYINYRTSA